jgi:hypothetical protein
MAPSTFVWSHGPAGLLLGVGYQLSWPLCVPAVLLSLQASLDPTSNTLSSWGSGPNPCQGWRGVICSPQGRVAVM